MRLSHLLFALVPAVAIWSAQACKSDGGDGDGCDTDEGCTQMSGTTATTSSGSGGAGSMCSLPADNDCGKCENQNCCDVRTACYNDPACSQANDTQDACVMAANGDAAKEQACHGTFAASSQTAHDFYECDKTQCATQCGVPSEASCAAPADDACGTCENQHCCAERVACYGDASCSAANDALDMCTAAAGSDAMKLAACLDTFAASGSLAANFHMCDLTYCKIECGVP